MCCRNTPGVVGGGGGGSSLVTGSKCYRCVCVAVRASCPWFVCNLVLDVQLLCVLLCARALQGNGRMPGAHMLDPPPACGLGQWDVKPGCAGMGGAGAGVLLCRASFRAAAGAVD